MQYAVKILGQGHNYVFSLLVISSDLYPRLYHCGVASSRVERHGRVNRNLKVYFCLPAPHIMWSTLNLTPHSDTPTPHTVCCHLSVIRCNPSDVICFSLIKGRKLIIITLNVGFVLLSSFGFLLFLVFSRIFISPFISQDSWLDLVQSAWEKQAWAALLYMLYIKALIFQRGMKFLFQEACPHQTSLKSIPFSLLSLFVTAFFFLPQGHFKDSTYCKVYWLCATQCCVWIPSNCFEVGNSLTC